MVFGSAKNEEMCGKQDLLVSFRKFGKPEMEWFLVMSYFLCKG